MLLLILAIILFISSFIFGRTKGYWYKEFTPLGILLNILACLLLFVMLVIGGMSAKPIDEWAQSKLGNLNDGTAVYGSFVLGTGTVDSYPAYTYYKEVSPGVYQQRLLRDDTSSRPITVIQDSKEPYVKTHQTGREPYFGLWGMMVGYSQVESIEFHVPEGSIKTGVTLDAQ